jgi:SAM-dependent methyltransferase
MQKTDSDRGQVNASAAEVYDAFFVPALFGEWAGPLCAAAGVTSGDRVLDVACGTGATTRVAAEIAGGGGAVTGLDRNPGMLAVARANGPGIDWAEGLAEDLPFPDGAFERVLCQFGLMFFDDRKAALQQMARVLKPGGRMAVSVWDRVETSPGYARMVALIDRLFGPEPANALRAPFVLGDTGELGALAAEAGLTSAKIETQTGTARFDSIREWVRMDVRGWTLADMIDDAQYEQLVAAAESELGEFAGPDGRVAFAAPAHIVTWQA